MENTSMIVKEKKILVKEDIEYHGYFLLDGKLILSQEPSLSTANEWLFPQELS